MKLNKRMKSIIRSDLDRVESNIFNEPSNNLIVKLLKLIKSDKCEISKIKNIPIKLKDYLKVYCKYHKLLIDTYGKKSKMYIDKNKNIILINRDQKSKRINGNYENYITKKYKMTSDMINFYDINEDTVNLSECKVVPWVTSDSGKFIFSYLFSRILDNFNDYNYSDLNNIYNGVEAYTREVDIRFNDIIKDKEIIFRRAWSRQLYSIDGQLYDSSYKKKTNKPELGFIPNNDMVVYKFHSLKTYIMTTSRTIVNDFKNKKFEYDKNYFIIRY